MEVSRHPRRTPRSTPPSRASSTHRSLRRRARRHGPCHDKLMMVANLSLMGVASIAYILGSWFGPVSLSVPTVMVSKLLFNLLIMGWVLRMDSFSKEQQVGTYCIACAILLLPDIGPSDQPCLDVMELIKTPGASESSPAASGAVAERADLRRVRLSRGGPPLAVSLCSRLRALVPRAVTWEAILFTWSLWCCVYMVVLAKRKEPPSETISLAVYVSAQVVAAVISTSVSKMFPLVGGMTLILFFVIAIFFAAINVVSLILAATTVDQGEARPEAWARAGVRG